MAPRETTKDKLLTILKKESPLTVAQLAQRFHLTEMAIRKHLSALERDMLVYSSEVKQPIGRPIQIFSLSEKAEKLFPKSYENLTVDFLEDLKMLQGETIIDQLFENRGRRQAREYRARMENKTNEQKAQTLKQLQNEKGYMVDLLQVNAYQYELIEHNCPIYEVSRTYKQACKCETEMFKEVLGTDHVARTYCKADGDAHCRFLISFDSVNEEHSDESAVLQP